MDLVHLTTALNEIEADQICSLLKLEGIESMQKLTDFGAGSLDGATGMGGAREILVLEKDLEFAKALISTDAETGPG